MSQPSPTIPHLAAAKLLAIAPADLARLVDQGIITRIGKEAYQVVPLVQAYIAHLRADHQRQLQRPLQAEIAEHLDVSTRRVRELAMELGIESREVSLAEWRLRYIRQLREQAAGRAAAGDLDLATERARLAKEQADRISMQNAVTRKELAPAELIEEVLTKAGAKASKLLDTIPGELRRRAPQLTADDIAAIAGVIAKVRNIAAAISMSNLEEDDDEDDGAGSETSEEQRTEALLGLDADGAVQ